MVLVVYKIRFHIKELSISIIVKKLGVVLVWMVADLIIGTASVRFLPSHLGF